MARISKKNTLSFARWLILGTFPLFWCLLGHFGKIEYFENRAIDWRFRYRGERSAPVKVIYIDVDSLSLQGIGNFPWTRSYFTVMSKTLVDVAKVRAVGFDFVLSPTGLAESADRTRVRQSDTDLMEFLLRPGARPPVVFGASYVASRFLGADDQLHDREMPIEATEKRAEDDIEPPELTSFERPVRPNSTTWVTVQPPLVGVIDSMNGDVRTVPLWMRSNTRPYFALSVELARLYWGLPAGSIKPEGDVLRFVRPDGTDVARIPMRDRQLLDVNWFSAWISPQNPRIGFIEAWNEVLNLTSEDPAKRRAAQEFFAQDDFKDAIVLIGPVDKLLQDIAPTPFDDSQVPRVGIHGNLLKTIISGEFLRRTPEYAGYAITMLLTLLVTALAVASGTRVRSILAKIAAVLAMALYAYLTFLVFDAELLILPLVAPLGAAFTTSFAALVWDILEEQRQRGRIKGLFGTYLSPELVNRMVDSEQDPKLGGHEENITAYFSDIESFSGFSEKMTPALLVELMNEYLTACTDIVQEEGGTLDKYIGDAIVAMFGAPVPLPDHAYRACIATQRVQLRIAELREKWKSEGDKWPTVVHGLRARLGLNTGPAIIGNMGSRSRFSYTMMGDNVNLAARMESGAKSLGVYTMVTEATRQACEKHGDRVVFRYLDRIVVKGRTQPVPVHQIVCLRENLTERRQECLDLFAKGIERYLQQDWDAAAEYFRQSHPLEFSQPGAYPAHEITPSSLYLGRCTEMKQNPPGPAWDTVFHMKEK